MLHDAPTSASHPAAALAAEVRRLVQDLSYTVEDETSDTFTVHIDVVDAQWWTRSGGRAVVDAQWWTRSGGRAVVDAQWWTLLKRKGLR